MAGLSAPQHMLKWDPIRAITYVHSSFPQSHCIIKYSCMHTSIEYLHKWKSLELGRRVKMGRAETGIFQNGPQQVALTIYYFMC